MPRPQPAHQPAHQPGMVIDLRVGERLALSLAGADGRPAQHVTVEAEHKSGSTVRLRVVAPAEVRIRRERPPSVQPSARLAGSWQAREQSPISFVASMAS